MKTIRLSFEKKIIVHARIQIDEHQVFLFANGHAPVRVINRTNHNQEDIMNQAIELFEQENQLTLQRPEMKEDK